MRRMLFKLLVILLTLVLCVDFVRFIIFTSDGGRVEQFADIDIFTVLDILSGVNFSGDAMFKELLNSVQAIGDAGSAFISSFKNPPVTGLLVLDFILSYVRGLWYAILGLVSFIVAVIRTFISFFVWLYQLIKALYKVLNLLLGTSFGT